MFEVNIWFNYVCKIPINPQQQSIYNPVLTPQGTFRDSEEIRPTSHFTEEDRVSYISQKLVNSRWHELIS